MASVVCPFIFAVSCQYRRQGFKPWASGYSPWGPKRVRHDLATKQTTTDFMGAVGRGVTKGMSSGSGVWASCREQVTSSPLAFDLEPGAARWSQWVGDVSPCPGARLHLGAADPTGWRAGGQPCLWGVSGRGS